ncbi:MAG: hypothetical protein Q8R97_05690 [Brevundimonas sp.]|jgi:hypothetical protein|uniref:hypothetical protein n=1 Tax=Brevundimonas sp. TaxID=1871086 RepID=UPI0027454A56|nr:hypothetical protein [Brevundimonas sp.]MDP3400595.1 hypothetical protein [Brevundimonas sp.]MDZ4113521.1 hypothetical protein [Brevundimonas sp.]
MADATTAAKARIDKALALLERRMKDLKARPASAPPIGDDDLFAPRADAGRLAELEDAGREARTALAASAEAIRAILADDQDGEESA